MRTLGYLLVIVGFIGAALASVWHTEQTPWLYYLPPLAVGVVGVVFLRFYQRLNIGAEHTHVDQVQNLTDCLQRITDELGKLRKTLQESETYEVHGEIDRRFADDLAIFVEGRQSITRAHGLQAYADIMSSFAAAERYLNRVWSASADGYVDEVHNYLGRAHEQFRDSLERLRSLTSATTIPSPTQGDLT